MNREWHNANTTPKNATVEERIAWHKGHTQNCGCRPIPQGLMAKLVDSERPRTEPRASEGKHKST
jgi:hypothetical protein